MSGRRGWLARMYIEQVALIVEDYDHAIRFFVDILGFELLEDSPAMTNDGRPKRWVIVRPPGATTALLLARADGELQMRAVGDQFAGRVGLFLRVDDFEGSYGRMREAGVEFVTEPRQEPYGRVAVFLDVAGNRWDLLGPRPTAMALIQELDFIGVPSQDPDRARAFYRDVLGMRPDEHAQYEQWAGSTCFVVWEPEKVGMGFVAQTGNPLPLRVEDVHAARADLESKGVTFFGETFDTGVCHMAIFADPDGNQLMLHHRYAPYGDASPAT